VSVVLMSSVFQLWKIVLQEVIWLSVGSGLYLCFLDVYHTARSVQYGSRHYNRETKVYSCGVTVILISNPYNQNLTLNPTSAQSYLLAIRHLLRSNSLPLVYSICICSTPLQRLDLLFPLLPTLLIPSYTLHGYCSRLIRPSRNFISICPLFRL
jgi:hypothetical protein